MVNFKFIVQARYHSTRLPGKVLMDIGGIPLIEHTIDRINKVLSSNVSLVFAIPDEGQNNLLKDYLLSKGVDYIVGDTYDVLSRYIEASRDLADSDYVVRCTGDNPFFDFQEAQKIISFLKNNSGVDFAYPYKLPLGMGFEVVLVGALRSQLSYDLESRHKEHVTVWIKENSQNYNIYKVESFKTDIDIRLTVDYQEDLEMAAKTYQYFNEGGRPFFCSGDVYGLQKNDSKFFLFNSAMRQKSMNEYEKPK